MANKVNAFSHSQGFSWKRLPRSVYANKIPYGIGDEMNLVDWTGEQAFRTREFKRKSLRGLTVSSVDFRNCDFSGFSLGFFENCNFKDANFKDAIKVGTIGISVRNGFDHVVGMGVAGFGVAGLGDATVIEEKCGFKRCNITQEQIRQTRFWKEDNLRGITLEDMDLDGWDFSNKDLSYASLAGSSLENANFENAVLNGTSLNSWAFRRWSESPFLWRPTFTVEQLKQTKSWKEKKIRSCEFRGINFDNCDLSGFDFSYTRFIDCSFNNTNLKGAIISMKN